MFNFPLAIALQDISLQFIDILDEKTGTNSFWLAAFYGHGGCLNLLANAGANVFSKHKETKSNALHVALQRKHYEVAK